MKSKNPNKWKEPFVDKSSKSGWENEGGNSNKTNNAPQLNQPTVKNEGELTEIKKRQILSRCWESESDSDMADTKVVGDV